MLQSFKALLSGHLLEERCINAVNLPFVGCDIIILMTLSSDHNQHWSLTTLSASSLPSLHGGGLPRPVVAQEGGDLSLVELEVEVVDGQLGALLVDLHQVVDGHAQHQVGGLRFDAVWFERGKATRFVWRWIMV